MERGGATVNHVEFRVRDADTALEEHGGPPDAEVEIRIDGRDLVALAAEVERPFAEAEGETALAGSYAGMRTELMAPPARLLWGEDEWAEDGRVSLLRCACGSEACWPLMARIEVGEETVTWHDFAQPHRGPASPGGHWRYDRLGPFVFDRAQYAAAVERLGRDAAAWRPPA